MPVRLVFETHSTTVDNESGIATGWLPGELSAEGRRQAVALGTRRRNGGFDALFVSDLGRALQTAEIAFAGAIPLYVDWRLRECNYGNLNGMPTSRLLADRLAHVEVPFPGGESYRDVVGRTKSLLHDLATRFAGGRVLLIGHSANRWALDHLLAGVPLDDLVAARFDWQEGWEYELARDAPGTRSTRRASGWRPGE